MFFNKMKDKAGIAEKYSKQAQILDNHLKKQFQKNQEIWADSEVNQEVYSDCSETSFDKYY